MATTIEIRYGDYYNSFDKLDYTVTMRDATEEESLLLKNANRGYLDAVSSSGNCRLKIFASHNNALSEFNAQTNFQKSQFKQRLRMNDTIRALDELKMHFVSDFSHSFDLFNNGIRFTPSFSTKEPIMILREEKISDEQRDANRDFASFLYEMTPEEREEYERSLPKTENKRTNYDDMKFKLQDCYHDKYDLYTYLGPFDFSSVKENAPIKNDLKYLFVINNSDIGAYENDDCKIINASDLNDSSKYDNKKLITYEPVLIVAGEIIECCI